MHDFKIYVFKTKFGDLKVSLWDFPFATLSIGDLHNEDLLIQIIDSQYDSNN